LSPIAAGTTVCGDRYRLDEVVGRGGMATVWRATDLQLERTVAIKVISDLLAEDPRFVARFEREARLAAGVNHPNLVKLFDFSSEDERPLLVMEYIAGGTLSERRADVEPVALARALLDALAHIHGAGILHRDIKPANVLLGADGSPRLTDFGIARSEDQTGLTLTGQVLGTLRYIAPEVADAKPATRQSDLYSLGVLLQQVAGDDPAEPLASLLPRLTARDPADRPASADEALAELDPTKPLAPKSADFERYSSTKSASFDQTARLEAPRHIRIRIRPKALAIAAALILLVAAVIAIASSGGGGKSAKTPAQEPHAAPPAAPLDQQLNQLEQLVRQAPST
jgi:serine/threonine protein kinase